MAEAQALPTFEDLLLRGAVAQILERYKWWCTWEQDRALWVRDAGSWFVAQTARHALSLRPAPAMDQVLQDKTLVRLTELSCEIQDDARLKLQKKVLRDLVEAPVDVSLEASSSSNPLCELIAFFQAQSLRDQSQAMEAQGDARLISWATVRALCEEAQAMATQRLMVLISALENDGQASQSSILSLHIDEPREPTTETIAELAHITDQLACVRVHVSNHVSDLFTRMTSVSDELKCLEYEPLPTLLLLDNAISRPEQQQLRAQFARLERQKTSNSADTKGDSAAGDVALIDPFMFAYTRGETRVMDEEDVARLASRASLDPQERMLDGMFLDLSSPFESEYVCGYYFMTLQSQWTPSDFLIDQDGHATIQSYVNNLNPLEHRRLYSSLGRLFDAMLPMFERVLGPEKTGGISLRGRQVQVVVTAMNMHLTPDQPRHECGDWHVSGRDQDRIVATGLYCYDQANTTAQRLSLASSVSPAKGMNDHIAMQQVYGIENTLPGRLYQPQGSITLPAHRAVAFGQSFSHRLEGFELEDRTLPGHRKFLAFHLVDPEHQLLSARHIPPQQLEWATEFLGRVWKANELPESVEILLSSFVFAPGEKWTQEMALTRYRWQMGHWF